MFKYRKDKRYDSIYTCMYHSDRISGADDPCSSYRWIIGKFAPMKKDISSLRMVQAIFKFILWLTGARVTVIGEENVPKDQAVLYVANHRSYFDILLTYSRCPGRTGYVAKKEMERYPLLSNWMHNLYCLFLDREDIKQGLKTILQAADYVKSGISVCIFPEGTRNKNSDELDMLPFHDGSFKIATRAKSPIIYSDQQFRQYLGGQFSQNDTCTCCH